MKEELKKAALAFGTQVAAKPVSEILHSASDFCRSVSDFLGALGYSDGRRLIQKGFSTGAYILILGAADHPWDEVDNALDILIEEEFVPAPRAREIIGLLLIALDYSPDHLLKVEHWVDGGEIDEDPVMVPRDSGDTVLRTRKENDDALDPVSKPAVNHLSTLFDLLSKSRWQDATAKADEILNKDPSCSRAYLGRMMAEHHIPTEAQLTDPSAPYYAESPWLSLAMKNADDPEYVTLKGYYNQNIYAQALAAMNNAKSETAYKNAAKYFNKCIAYLNSSQLRQECLSKAELCRKERLYKKALTLPLSEQPKAFKEIAGYRDADARRQKAEAALKVATRPTGTVSKPTPAPARPVSTSTQRTTPSPSRPTYPPPQPPISRPVSRPTSQTTPPPQASNSLSDWWFLILLLIAGALFLDYGLTIGLKDISGWYRWLWLPLIATVINSIVGSIISKADTWLKYFWSIPCVIWGTIRGIVVVVAYFRASSGWAVVLAIFLCLIMWALNALPAFIGTAFSWDD